MKRKLITKGAPQFEDFSAPEHIDVSFEIKEISEDGTFIGYGSTFGNVDLGRDVIEKGAFTKSLKRKSIKDIKLLWQHDSHQPIGVWESLSEDDKGLVVKGRLIREVRQAEEAYALMKAGAINAMSIGFSIPKGGHEIDEKKRVRVIKEVDLWEVSVVTFPMNPKAKIRRVKSDASFHDLEVADKGRIWDPEVAKARIAQWAGGGSSISEMDWEKYGEGFLHYNADAPAELASYHLPIADVVGGTLTVIPKAVFIAAGVMLTKTLEGYAPTVPDNAKDGVISHIERYYSKMDLDSPFAIEEGALVESGKNYVTARLSAAIDAKEYEQTLREVGFSNSEAKAITVKIGPRREVETTTLADTLKSANETLTNL